MGNTYEPKYQYLLREIHTYSPNTVLALVEIHEACGARVAFYAALIITYLEARWQRTLTGKVGYIPEAESLSFTFCRMLKNRPHVRELFTTAVNCYQADRSRRFAASA
jgi:hypothetical protein